jgi:hypothetical protein
MKKVLFIALAAAAITFTGCTNKPATTEPEPTDSAQVEVIPVDSLQAVIEAGDTTAIGNLFTQVQSKIEELKNIDPAKAKEYLATVQTFLKENAEKIKGVVGTGAVAGLIDTVTNLPEIELPNVGEAAAEAVEEAKDAVEGAKDAAVDAAAEKVNEAAAKVEEKVDAAKQKVEDAANKAVEDGKAAVKDAAADAANKLLKK